MAGIIIALPKIEDARGMKNILVKNGYEVSYICSTGAQAVIQMENLRMGIVICGYKLPDMLFSEIRDCLPEGFEMLLLASRHILEEFAEGDLMCLSMPLKVHEFVDTVDMMLQSAEGRRRQRRNRPRERSGQEISLIREAKGLLMARNHMSEEEAHRYIQKISMDSSTDMVETAQMILTVMGI